MKKAKEPEPKSEEFARFEDTMKKILAVGPKIDFV